MHKEHVRPAPQAPPTAGPGYALAGAVRAPRPTAPAAYAAASTPAPRVGR